MSRTTKVPAQREKEFSVPEVAPHRGARAYAAFAGIGLAAGLLSGMFGVGGGTVIVPLLVLFAAFDQRRAAGTSLAAIVPTATIGVISYAVLGDVAWVPALVLAAGAIVGAQIGTRLLPRVSQSALRWGFVAFLLVVPARDAALEVGWASGLALVALGMGTGVVSGLIGVGGGIVVVPFLMLVFGASDLVAKGTSLLMMIPAALSGTFGNLRTGNVEILPAVTIGAAACTTTAVGAWIATIVDPAVGNALFAVFLVVIAIQMAVKAVRGRRPRAS